MTLTTKIAPSLLSADFANLVKEIKRINRAGADEIHFDVMDGNFVPNISVGAGVLAVIREYTDLPIEAHLMITNPLELIPDFCRAGANIVTVHYEACERTLDRVIDKIYVCGSAAGIAFNPTTHPSVAPQYLLKKIHRALIMTVHPGFGGQEFIHGALENVRWLREKYPTLEIEVDGGICYKRGEVVLLDEETPVYQAALAGANIFVAGSAVFGERTLTLPIRNLRRIAEAAWKSSALLPEY